MAHNCRRCGTYFITNGDYSQHYWDWCANCIYQDKMLQASRPPPPPREMMTFGDIWNFIKAIFTLICLGVVWRMGVQAYAWWKTLSTWQHWEYGVAIFFATWVVLWVIRSIAQGAEEKPHT